MSSLLSDMSWIWKLYGRVNCQNDSVPGTKSLKIAEFMVASDFKSLTVQ